MAESEGVPEVADILAHATHGTKLLPPAPGRGTITHTFTVSGAYVLHGFLVIDGQNTLVGSSQPFNVTVPVTVPAVPLPVFSAPTVSGLEVTFAITHAGTSDYTFYVLHQFSDVETPSFDFISTNSLTQYVSSVAATGTRFSYAFSFPGTYRLDGYFEGATGDEDVASSAEFTILRAPRFDTPAVASDNLIFTVTNDGESTCTLHYAVVNTSTGVGLDPGFTSGALYGTRVVGADSSSAVTADASGLVEGTTYSVHGYFALSGAPSAVTVSDEFTVLSSDPTFSFAAPSVSILPNPAEDVLFIQSSAAGTALFYDLSGVLLDSRAITSGTSKILFTDHPSGLYLVRFVFADGEIIRRVVRR